MWFLNYSKKLYPVLIYVNLSTTVLDNSKRAVSNKKKIDSNQYIHLNSLCRETSLFSNLTRNLQWQLEGGGSPEEEE